ncbi:uncharacterized protein [Drosophila virilis]|uniref:uncharacterized protein n=1 Tax=Drosophila virilis TaxID=7244 RepID=UPI0038B3E834
MSGSKVEHTEQGSNHRIKASVSVFSHPLRSKGNERSMQIMEATTTYLEDEKRWQTGLLWRFDRMHLPDSYQMAVKRLKCLEAKMSKDPPLKEFMMNTTHDYKQKGYIRRFKDISGDIREMLHQVKVRLEDQPAQKFLWRDGDSSRFPETYVMQVMTFEASCSPALANYVKNRNAERFVAEHPDAVKAICENTFVDDWLQSGDTGAEMIQLAETVKRIHDSGGFEMRRWTSNSKLCRLLVASKTRVAPLKPVSIPRMELMAAVLGLSLAKCIQKEMWFNGPPFLYLEESQWLQSEIGPALIMLYNAEEQPNHTSSWRCILPDLQRFSKLEKLRAVQLCVLDFLRNITIKVRLDGGLDLQKTLLLKSRNEMDVILIRICQEEEFYDYFGPYDIVVGRRREKRWGVLLTCLTVRAVHLDIATLLSTDSYLCVLKSFVARRGCPRRMLSDNGTTFRGASRVLKDEIERISPALIERQYPELEFTFIPPGSPHMGRSWERMVRSTKSILSEILPTSGLGEEVLRAALADVIQADCVREDYGSKAELAWHEDPESPVNWLTNFGRIGCASICLHSPDVLSGFNRHSNQYQSTTSS